MSKVYGEGSAEVQALDGVSLSVEAGALVAVMGPSGSGKSALLTIAGSLEAPDSGRCWSAGPHCRECRVTSGPGCGAGQSGIGGGWLLQRQLAGS